MGGQELFCPERLQRLVIHKRQDTSFGRNFVLHSANTSTIRVYPERDLLKGFV